MPLRQYSLFLFLIAVTPLLFASRADGEEAANRLSNFVKPRSRPAGAPGAADVVMRTLSLHPRGKSDPYDTMDAIRAFHVSRLEWSYVTDKDFIQKVEASGRVFGGAASAPSYQPRPDDSDRYDEIVIRDAAGEPIIAPWKRTWKRTLWGCVNNPEYERGYTAYLKNYIDAGAQVMQRDEPGANWNATRWGGCFCPHCVKGFREYLAENTTHDQRRDLGIEDLATFDYRRAVNEAGAPVGDKFGTWDGGPLKLLFIDFQTKSTIDFHRRTRAAVDDHAGRHVLFSCNNGARRFSPIEMGFDWFFGELSYGHALPRNLVDVIREATENGRVQVLTMPKKGDQNDLPGWQRRTRQTIATTYAAGGLCMVPWDVYMPKDAPRYFGTPEQYADLFGFIRACRDYLDGYEEAAATGCGVTDAGTETRSSIQFASDEDKILAIARAKPGESNAAVAVHLVSWSDEPGPATLKLRTADFVGGKRLAGELLVPPSYDEASHKEAERTGDYSVLRKSLKLKGVVDGQFTQFEIPPLAPWGILVVTADQP